jgi:transcriptional regulator with XRE-family HTH domain
LEKSLNIILSPQKLRHYRKVADKRQFQIADILGVDRTTYNGYEKKQGLEVPIDKAKAVADFLNVPLKDLQQDEKLEKSGAHHTDFKHQIS